MVVLDAQSRVAHHRVGRGECGLSAEDRLDAADASGAELVFPARGRLTLEQWRQHHRERVVVRGTISRCREATIGELVITDGAYERMPLALGRDHEADPPVGGLVETVEGVEPVVLAVTESDRSLAAIAAEVIGV